MVKRIDLFLPPRSQYGVLHHFTHKMAEALEHCGVKTRVLEAEYFNPGPFLEAIMNDPPDCTLSFNGLLPDDKGRFFCDMIHIPHVACIVDSQNLFIPLVHSPLTVIVCADDFSCNFFRGLRSKNVLFMPHGVEKDIQVDPSIDRCYDVTVLCSLIDYEKMKEQWKEKYDKAVCLAMDEAIDVTLSDSETPYVQALVNAVDRQMELHYKLDPKKIDFVSVMDDLEMYLKGRSRVEMIRAIKDAKVHVFGSASETASWDDYLKGHGVDYVVHESVPYSQALEILSQTKILLNSSPWMKYGGHERIFSGLVSGALVMTTENPYMKEHFKDGEEIVFFHTNAMDELNERVVEYLSDEALRNKVVAAGKEKVLKEHTFDQRAKGLLEELKPILTNLYAEIKEKQAKEVKD